MFASRLTRRWLLRRIAGCEQLRFDRTQPPVVSALAQVDSLGLYLHVPFCRQICPYCPYNKTLYQKERARRYVDAVKREIEIYAPMVIGKPITSVYIGGGTPTTLVDAGLDSLLDHIRDSFDIQCGIRMESHPNDLSHDTLERIRAMGVEYLSMGIEALQDHHLKTLRRPYTVAQACEALARARQHGFKCVNADLIFALPNQTRAELEEAAQILIDLEADQIASYPLFDFPYTEWGRSDNRNNGTLHGKRPNVFGRRSMLRTLEQAFYRAGYRRTSVWAFTRNGVERYCSVTVPRYLGLGASGSTYLDEWFYLNTFDVESYCDSLEHGKRPIGLSIELTPMMQMAGWLYWRLYETRFRPTDFERRFGRPINEVYGWYLRMLKTIGWLRREGEELVLTDPGIYWLHVAQNAVSINSIGSLWGTATSQAWPSEVAIA